MSPARTPDRRKRVRRALLVGALALVWAAAATGVATGDDRPHVSAVAEAYVDAGSGRVVEQVRPGQHFFVRYALSNDNAYPVVVSEVRGDFGAPSACPVVPAGTAERGELPVVLNGGSSGVSGEDVATWQREGGCSDVLEWAAGSVAAERVPTEVEADAEDHRMGETTRLGARVRSEWLSVSSGRVEFSVDGRPVGSARVRDGRAALEVGSRRVDVGRHRVVAEYEAVPDGPAGSVSEPVVLTVAQADRQSSTRVAASSQRYDHPGRLRASVAPEDAAGDVQFLVDGEPFGDPVRVRSGEAELRTGAARLEVGTHSVRAAFSSDEESLAGSTSPRSEFAVSQVPTTVRAEVAPPRASPGSMVTLRGRVDVGADGYRLPDGARVDVLDATGGRVGQAGVARAGGFEVTVTVPADAPDGRLVLFVSYPGTSTFGGAIVDRAVEVERPSPSPTPSPAPASPATPVAEPSEAPPPPVDPGPPGDSVTDQALIPASPSPLPALMGTVMLVAGGAVLLRRALR